MIVIDIETRPLSLDRLKQVVPPFKSQLQHPGEFDPNSVKVGNIKDPEKIAAKMEVAENEHAKRCASFTDDLAREESDYWSECLSKAALAAETATVCAIGYTNDNGVVAIDLDLELTEEQIIRRFWLKVAACQQASPQRQVIGFNSNRFDIPFLVRRSWYLGVDVPRGVFTPTGYLSHVFIDLLDIWQCGNRRDYVSLDRVCRACGIPGKPEDCSGAFFHQMVSDEATRGVAVKYLENDLAMTIGLARKFRVL
jgi:hypothetical protein